MEMKIGLMEGAYFRYSPVDENVILSSKWMIYQMEIPACKPRLSETEDVSFHCMIYQEQCFKWRVDQKETINPKWRISQKRLYSKWKITQKAILFS